MALVNCQRDFDRLRQRLEAFQAPVRIGFEATGTYHRPLATFSITADLSGA